MIRVEVSSFLNFPNSYFVSLSFPRWQNQLPHPSLSLKEHPGGGGQRYKG